MNVLVIPEDFTKDQYVLKPIVQAMFVELGKPRANIRVCQEPRLAGVEQAMRWERIEEILQRYPMVDLFLLIVDRDGNQSRKRALEDIEQKAAVMLSAGHALCSENAWQELEVWLLAGHELPSNWLWRDVRRELHPKETYFEPLARSRGLVDEPGGGRKTLGREAGANYRRVRTLCPEDVQVLEGRIAELIGRA